PVLQPLEPAPATYRLVASRRRLCVRARSVDLRDLRAECPQVRRQLAAMMDTVVVREPDPLGARHRHHAEEVERLVQLVVRNRAYRRERLRHLLLVEGDDVRDRAEGGLRLLRLLRIELEHTVANALQE